ncbi:hypothetical protein FBU30_003961 [Linnemannia zychae]|nr:hypothetical protein FBU30_003961 [Linnemannia zychae]
MAVLGDFDALTPVVMTGQQNSFEGNTFSILELAKVPSVSENNSTGQKKPLSVPVLLASFVVDPPAISANGSIFPRNVGITSTCVLDDAPHQIYIAGNFKQIPAFATFTSNSATAANDSSSIPFINNAPSSGLNYIGMYDSRQKRFMPMDNGLDGPVQDLFCDSVTKQVYVVGQFMGPVQFESLSEVGSSDSSGYQTLSAFGGGVAIWKRISDSTVEMSPPTAKTPETAAGTVRASGIWTALPFKGVNGIVTSVTKTQDGTFYFGGQFDTTTDGEASSAPDSQPVNLETSKVMTGNGLSTEQDRNIICDSSSTTPRNWIMQDNVPGYWRVLFPYYITPTLFRIWNIDTTQGPEFANRGTKTFSIIALPSNQHLNLSYIDPITHLKQYCTVCTLESRNVMMSVHGGYQDFMVTTPTLLNAVQVDIISWEGQSGGLGEIEIYQSEIFVRAVDELNFSSRCSPSHTIVASSADHRHRNDMTAYSSSIGADWMVTKIEDGWQTVKVASISATNAELRKQAYVDMSPYLQETGLYDVYLYTPACSSSGVTPGKPSNACAHRGFVDVSMYFGSPNNAVSVTISQTNTADKYDKIYSGMISHTTREFRPHVIVSPSVSKMGASGGGATQTVIVDSIQFVKQATLNNTNSLIFYRPGNSVTTINSEKGQKDVVQGLDYSTWGNLPVQIPSGALVNALVSYFGPFRSSSAAAASTLFIAGAFQSEGYSNIVAWDGFNYIGLGATEPSSGLDGIVSDMVLYQSSLYIVGSFRRAFTTSSTTASDLCGLAVYDIIANTWMPFGNPIQTFHQNAQFQSIQLTTNVNGQFQLMIGGQFSWNDSNYTDKLAIWDLDNQMWVHSQQSSQAINNNDFPFGYIRGEISYLNRVLGSNSNSATSPSSPSSSVLLAAGMIDSLDMYQVSSPENLAWLTTSGALKTTNLSPAISTSAIPSTDVDNLSSTTSAMTATTLLLKTNAGVMYYNPASKAWITLISGAHADGSIGAGYFNSPSSASSILTFKPLDLASASPSSPIVGEVLALGLQKDENSGFTSMKPGSDLLLLGGNFKSSSGLASLLIYDLLSNQPVLSSPALRGVASQAPIVNVIKQRPGDKLGTLVIAGDFSGVGSEVSCELICIWNPADARTAINNKKPLESSFKNVYGDSMGSTMHQGVLKGVINDITFEDDKNMFIAGDLIVNDVACGVASFNFDNGKWTTFGSIMNSTSSASVAARPPGPDTLTGPVTAIAHDTFFHQFFVAGRSRMDGSAYLKKWNGDRFIRVSSEFMPTSDIHRMEILPASKDAPDRTSTSSNSQSTTSDDNDNDNDNGTMQPPSFSSTPSSSESPETMSNTNDSNDTTTILEQGFILLISGKIVLGNPISLSSSASIGFNAATAHISRQESSSLAFFDGQSWFPFLLSSRNATASPLSDTAGSSTPSLVAREDVIHLSHRSNDDNYLSYISKRVDSATGSSSNFPNILQGGSHTRIRDQGIFRALAIAHMPRIIAREYLSVPIVILISVAISLALITFIVVFGFLFVFLKRRLSKDKHAAKRPRLGSSFMEDGYDGYLHRPDRPGGLYSNDSSLGANQGAAFASPTGLAVGPTKSGSFFKRSKSKAGEHRSSSALVESLGISGALDYNNQRKDSAGGTNTLVGSPTTFEKPGTVGTSAGKSLAGQKDGDHQNGSVGNNGTGGIIYRPNSTIQQATGAMVTEFVRSQEQQRSASAAGVGGSGARAVATHEVEGKDRPPSPDRRSKKSHLSGLNHPGAHIRDSTGSDLTNPASQSRYASLLDPSNANQVSSPISHTATTPTSPATAMTTPSDAIHNLPNPFQDAHAPNRDSTASSTNRLSTPFGNIAGGSGHDNEGNGTGGSEGGNSGGNAIYYARYPFRAREIGELGFKAGEKILVVDQSDDVWWMGVIQDPISGQQMHGVFPSNYVASTP